MPLEVNELVHHVTAAAIKEDRLRESPELRGIRESIAMPILNDAFVLAETPWLTNLRFVFLKAIRQVWIEAQNDADARARANWLFSVLPNVMEWCPNPDDEGLWAAAKQQISAQTAILMVFTDGKGLRQRNYFEWLETQVLTPLREAHPEIWDATIDFLKTYLVQLWEVDLEEE